jgi:hypothetical protein
VVILEAPNLHLSEGGQLRYQSLAITRLGVCLSLRSGATQEVYNIVSRSQVTSGFCRLGVHYSLQVACQSPEEKVPRNDVRKCVKLYCDVGYCGSDESLDELEGDYTYRPSLEPHIVILMNLPNKLNINRTPLS